MRRYVTEEVLEENPAFQPTGSERVATLEDGTIVFEDGRGRFTLFQNETNVGRVPFGGDVPSEPTLADIDMTERAGEIALAAGLTAADFAGKEPSGKTGHTVADVQRIIEEKES